MRNDWKTQPQFNYRVCFICTSDADKIGLPSRKCGHLKYACIHKIRWAKFRASILCNVLIEQTSFSRKTCKAAVARACVCVSVCLDVFTCDNTARRESYWWHFLSKCIQFHFDFDFDLNLHLICSQRVKAVCGSEMNPRNYVVSILLNTAFIWLVNISFSSFRCFFLCIFKQMRKENWWKNPVLLCRFILNAHTISEAFFLARKPFTKKFSGRSFGECE